MELKYLKGVLGLRHCECSNRTFMELKYIKTIEVRLGGKF